MSEVVKHINIDAIEKIIADNNNPIELPLVHRFTDGIYVREIFMPKGTLLTSKIHKTRHQFMVLKGEVSVLDEQGNEVRITAPHIGITEIGTRRVLFIHEDCVWATVHANPDNENEVEIEARIIEPHDNELLSEGIKEAYQKILSQNKTTVL